MRAVPQPACDVHPPDPRDQCEPPSCCPVRLLSAQASNIEVEILPAGEEGPRRLDASTVRTVHGLPFLTISEFLRAKIKAWMRRVPAHPCSTSPRSPCLCPRAPAVRSRTMLRIFSTSSRATGRSWTSTGSLSRTWTASWHSTPPPQPHGRQSRIAMGPNFMRGRRSTVRVKKARLSCAVCIVSEHVRTEISLCARKGSRGAQGGIQLWASLTLSSGNVFASNAPRQTRCYYCRQQFDEAPSGGMQSEPPAPFSWGLRRAVSQVQLVDGDISCAVHMTIIQPIDPGFLRHQITSSMHRTMSDFVRWG